MLRCGNAEFHDLASLTNKKFEMDDDTTLPCQFTGFRLSRCAASSHLILDQFQYLEHIKPLPTDASFSNFRSVRMKLAWLAHSRPDILCEISRLAQVTESTFHTKDPAIINTCNKLRTYAQGNPVCPRFPPLDIPSMSLLGFSDASFANNDDSSTQLGYILFIVDKTGASAPLHFRSYKARRICRSVLTGELIAFADLFDVAHTLAMELRRLHPGSPVPLRLFTDSKSLFDVISKGTRTAEPRLMLDIAAARQAYERRDISDIGFVRSGDNLADGLTKPMRQAKLRTALEGKLIVHPEQWIIRNQNV